MREGCCLCQRDLSEHVAMRGFSKTRRDLRTGLGVSHFMCCYANDGALGDYEAVIFPRAGCS